MGSSRGGLRLVESSQPPVPDEAVEVGSEQAPIGVRAPAALEDPEIQAIGRVDPDRGYEIAIEKHRDALLRHAASIVRDWVEAVDIVQEVFIRALAERRFFEHGFYMRAWLYRATTNRCFNTVRDRKRRAKALDRSPPVVAATGDGFEIAAQAQQQLRVLDAIGWMSEDHQELLMLRYYADLSNAEISAVTGLPLGTVMSRLSRARRAMLEVIAECGVDYSGW